MQPIRLLYNCLNRDRIITMTITEKLKKIESDLRLIREQLEKVVGDVREIYVKPGDTKVSSTQ